MTTDTQAAPEVGRARTRPEDAQLVPDQTN